MPWPTWQRAVGDDRPRMTISKVTTAVVIMLSVASSTARIDALDDLLNPLVAATTVSLQSRWAVPAQSGGTAGYLFDFC
ncbi:hypothetical protein [Mycobacterium uberis]|uniref:hypothetical protein n=1 Tax=Mycobacterium uberis TaxID=2162698 RepID=UPI000E302C60|nr:hypothetical protein [Mycobacterium uberis]